MNARQLLKLRTQTGSRSKILLVPVAKDPWTLSSFLGVGVLKFQCASITHIVPFRLEQKTGRYQ